MKAKNIADFRYYEQKCGVPYVIMTEDGHVIGTDDGSGGYPWVPFSINHWKIWSLIDATGYRDMFSSEINRGAAPGYPWKIVPLMEALGHDTTD